MLYEEATEEYADNQGFCLFYLTLAKEPFSNLENKSVENTQIETETGWKIKKKIKKKTFGTQKSFNTWIS